MFYGDATSEEALRHARIEMARLVVLRMNDPAAAERVVDSVRRVAPAVPVLIRTRYLLEREGLLALGASDVVEEEVESAVAVVARMLRWVRVPSDVIAERVRSVRAETQLERRTS